MTKTVVVCDICGKQIELNETFWIYDKTKRVQNICAEVCEECLRHGLEYDRNTMKFKLKDIDKEEDLSLPGERMAR